MEVLNSRSKDLHQQIIECTDQQQVLALKLQVVELQKLVESTVSEISTYEKKRTTEILESLFKFVELKGTQIDSRKFSFQGAPIPPISIPRPKGSIKKENSSDVNSVIYEDVVGVKKTIDNPNGHVLVRNVQNSIVATTKAGPASIHIKGGNDSILKIYSDGPTFIHDLKNVVLIIKSHQLRLHNVCNSTVIVDKIGDNNTIIVERCRDLKVKTIAGDNFRVDDFDWPTKSSKNPHYEVDNSEVDYSKVDEIKDGNIQRAVIEQWGKE